MTTENEWLGHKIRKCGCCDTSLPNPRDWRLSGGEVICGKCMNRLVNETLGGAESNPKPLIMRAGPCRLRDGREGVAERLEHLARGLLWSVTTEDERHYVDDAGKHVGGKAEYDVVAMLDDEPDETDQRLKKRLSSMPDEVFQKLVTEIMKDDKPKPLVKDMWTLLRPHTPAPPKIEKPVMDESVLPDWAVCYACDEDGDWWWFSKTPNAVRHFPDDPDDDSAYWDGGEMAGMIPHHHAPTLPDGMRWQETLTMVDKKGDNK